MSKPKTSPIFKNTETEELGKLLAGARAAGNRVVFTNGCFDLLHVGHIRYLREAAELGDILITAINGDSSARLLKGEGRPVMNECERSEIIAAINGVDYVIIFDDLNVERLLLALKPDIHAKGTDYTEETVPEREVVRSYGGEIAITGDPKSRSSTALLSQIKQ
ncbi:MAG: adenylyltransferase/cytidyltransferase family protein [bacterium]